MSHLRHLDYLNFVPPPTPAVDIGAAGELKWIPLSKLYVDEDYQRAILDSGKANIRRMIEGFSWLLFGTLVVGQRDGGRFAIIDGQHRATAAKLHGEIDRVPCLVLTGGPRDEARAFSAINGNVTRIHPLQSFRANVASGDAAAVALVAACAKVEVTIAPYPKQDLLPGETLALGAVRKIAKTPWLLSATLRLLRAADPSAGLSATAILGTAHALTKRPDFVPKAVELGRKLAACGGAARLVAKAAERRATRGGAVWSNYADLIAMALVSAQQSGGAPISRLMGGR